MSPNEFASYIPGSLLAWKVLFCVAAFWSLLEIGFFLVIQFAVLPEAQKLPKTQPFHGDMMRMMKRAVDLVKQMHCYDFPTYLTGFCRGAQFKDIYIDNFRSFLVWAMYNKHFAEASQEELKQAEIVLKYAQKEHPELKNMPKGFNPDVQHCRMTLDPIPILHRPLLMYVIIRLKEALTHAMYLPAYGFQRGEVNGQTYWYKRQSGANSKTTTENSSSDEVKKTISGSSGSEPMLFLHGISTGWGGYVDLACAMGAGRDIILVDMDAVKLNSLQFQMPTPQKFADNIARILDRHHIDRVSLVGHSFGTMTAGWVLRALPERISHLTLLDPVSMLLSFPEVAYSFLYRHPSTVMEWIIHVFAAREITISHTLRRNFWWYNNDLWLEEVPAHIGVVVGVATGDEITNPKAIQEYVQLCRRARLEGKSRLSDVVLKAPVARHISSSASTSSTSSDATTSSEKSNLDSLLTKAESFTELEVLDARASEAEEPKDILAAGVAMIECFMWDKYSHGQILARSPEHLALVAAVRGNEKLGVSTGI
jgi:pimeloyl-ACP methyl ester carboxylesterase